MIRTGRALLFIIIAAFWLGGAAAWAQAPQPGQTCTASAMNRTAPVAPDGTFALFNLPADQGLLRVRITCTNGETVTGQSELLVPVPNGVTVVGDIQYQTAAPIPDSLIVTASPTLLSIGDTAQVTVTGHYPDGTTSDLTAGATGTSYVSSNSNIASVNADGRVTAAGSGSAAISVLHEGALSLAVVVVRSPNGDTDNDGMPDDWEVAHGLNPSDPSDAALDPDGDGLTNLQEYQARTDPNKADTDNDGLSDSYELQRGTSPVIADTDGDGLLDGAEVTGGTNPLKADTDNDGLPDGLEVRIGTDPLKTDTNGNGILDGLEDADGDGLSNLDEFQIGTNLLKPDTDGDGISDSEEVVAGADGYITNPLNPDTDGDGLLDGQETAIGLNPTVPDATTSVTGTVVDPIGVGVSGAVVKIFDVFRGISGANGSFSLPVVPATVGDLQAVAVTQQSGKTLTGRSAKVPPVPNGVTTVGTIQLGVITTLDFQTDRVGLVAQGSSFDVTAADFNNDGRVDLATTAFSAPQVTIFLGQTDGTFAKTGTFNTLGTAASAAVRSGDFNEDGKMDLALSSSAFGVLIMLGNGDGTFGTATAFSVGGGTRNFTLGDFNRDGHLDLAAIVGSNIAIILGDGTGHFGAPNNVPSGSSRFYIISADLNHDNNPDLVAISNGAAADSAGVLLGNGDGTFQAPVGYPLDRFPSSVVAGDFNGDGHLDLATGNNNANVLSVLIGNGDGTFKPKVSYTGVITGGGPVTAGDYNMDGHLDLAVISINDQKLQIFLGKGDGTFTPGETEITGHQPQVIISGDWNQDGKVDLATADVNPGFGVCLFIGNGDGTFGRGLNFPVGARPTSVIAKDFDRDGILDLAVADPNFGSLLLNDVAVLRGLGRGRFPSPIRLTAGTNPTGVASGDFNEDGIPDLVAANQSSGTVSIFLGSGDGRFGPASNVSAGPNAKYVAPADFNLDGHLDLAVVTITPSIGGTVSILLGNGTGGFSLFRTLTVVNQTRSLAVGDFNGDAILDLAVDSKVFFGLGNGDFGPPVSVSLVDASSDIVAVDLNNDGYLDLAAPGQVALNLGNGTFGTTKSFSLGAGITGPGGIAAGDFNGDGFMDLVSAFRDNNTVSVVLGKGDGTFQPAIQFPTGAQPNQVNGGQSSIVAADFNSDGLTDIATVNYLSNDVTILLNTSR